MCIEIRATSTALSVEKIMWWNWFPTIQLAGLLKMTAYSELILLNRILYCPSSC